MTRRILMCLAIAVICHLQAAPASATTLSLGARIAIAPNLFALPIYVEEATALESWAFDLTYDPIDVQVNTGCDPFSGDVYCSLFTGPVTEGDFFASGSPFNVLNPGFVVLDPATLMQTGLLLAVNGAYGGFPQAPPGTGVIAYVEFLQIGDGTSPIRLQNATAIETAPVPEPGTLALLASGLVLSRSRRLLTRIKRH